MTYFGASPNMELEIIPFYYAVKVGIEQMMDGSLDLAVVMSTVRPHAHTVVRATDRLETAANKQHWRKWMLSIAPREVNDF